MVLVMFKRALETLFKFCSVELNHLCNFGRGHHEEHFCDFYFEFRPVVKEKMTFKDISYLELWLPFDQWFGTICEILVEGIMRKTSATYFEF